MKNYLWLILILVVFSLRYQAMADEVSENTDGSFVGENPKVIDSSFVGDISNSMVNESWGKEDIPKKTDGAFVGENSIQADNTYFSGDDYDKDEQKGKVSAFAGENSINTDDYGK